MRKICLRKGVLVILQQFIIYNLCFSFIKSEEDLALKQQVELYVERVQDSDPGLQKVAFESMRYAGSRSIYVYKMIFVLW